MRCTKLMIVCVSGFIVISSSILAAAESAKPQMTFNVTFDKFHANADFSKGDGKSTLQASLELRSTEGIKGSGLALDAQEKCAYHIKDNLNMKSATVSLWVAPFNWTSDDNRYNHFFTVASQDPKFRLQIYAPEGRDAVLYCEFGAAGESGFKKFSVNAPVQWKKGEWHKIDACWDAKCMKIYLDGNAGEKIELSNIQFPALEEGSFNIVPIWTGPASKTHSGDDRTIADEVKIYDGVLTGEEIKANYASERRMLSGTLAKSTAMVPALKSKMTIDGKLDEGAWQSAAIIPVMVMYNAYPADKITHVSLCHDAEKMYIGFTSSCAGNPLVASHAERDGKIWEDDSYEMFIYPRADKPDIFYQFIINAKAAVYDAMVGNVSWNGEYECVSVVANDCWTVEIALPHKSLEVNPPKSGDEWKANFCRNWKMPPPQKPLFTSWCEFSSGYQDGFGTLIFSDAPNAAQMTFAPGLPTGDLSLKVGNKCGSRVNCSVKVSTKDAEIIAKTTTIKEQSAWEIKESLIGVKNATLNAKVVSDDGKNTLADYSVRLYIKDPIEAEYIPEINDKKCLVDIDFGNLDEKCLSLLKEGKLTLEIKVSDPTNIKSAKTFPVHAVKEIFEVPLEWADGEYVFEYVLRNGTETVSASKGKLVKPPTPWLNAQAGVSNEVLEPWTPLEQSGDGAISCWGRTYRFNGLLPTSMVNQGKDILAGSVTIQMETDKGTFPLTVKETKCAQMKPDRAEFEGSAAFGSSGIEAKWRMWIEYDGLMAVDLSVIPPKDGFTIRSLKMEIPLRKDIATFIRKPKRVAWDGAEWKSSFEPYVWIGNDDEGFDLFFNSDANWLYDKNDKNPSVTTVKTGKDSTVLTVNIITKEAEVRKTLAYNFGFQATPIRPLMKDWRHFNNRTRDWKGRNACNWVTQFPSQFGLLDVVMPEEFQKHCREMKNKGVKIFAYSGALSTPNDNPTYNFFKTKWANPYGSTFTNQMIKKCPMNPGNKTPHSIVPISQASSYTDYLTWQAQQMMANFDLNSIYTDMDRLLPDENSHHGSGYRNDAFGRSGPTYDILQRRAFYKRLLTVCRHAKRGLGLGLKMTHAHDELVLPYHGFSDLFYPGEQYSHLMYQKPYFYMDNLEPAAWRVELNSKASGINHIFLPEFGRGSGDNKDMDNPDYTQSLIAVTLVNDVVTCGAYCDKSSIEELWALKEKTGINKDEAKFIAYWRPNSPMKTDIEKSAASVYVLPGHAVAVVVNFSPEPRDVPVKMNLSSLGLGNDLAAFDERAGKELAFDGQGFAVPVKGRNYALVSLKKKQQP